MECVVYQAEVNSDTPATNEKENIMRYIGLTEGPLKTRYTSHKSDMASKNSRVAQHYQDTYGNSKIKTFHIVSAGQ